MTYPQYLRQLAADHTDSGTTATAEDYAEAARRIEEARDLFATIAKLAAQIPGPRGRVIARCAQTAAIDLEEHP